MSIRKRIIQLSLVCLLMLTSLLQPLGSSDLFSSSDNVAQAASDDWIENGKNNHRNRNVTDSELNPLIMFKAKLKLGWSTSQVIAVGDYFYVLASIPSSSAGSGNFFELPEGTYLYKIPVSFKFQANLSNAQLRDDMKSKGLKIAQITTNFVANYSHVTYDPTQDFFYIGVGEYITGVNPDTFTRTSTRINAKTRLTGSPLIVGNDLMVIATSTADTTTEAGRIYAIKGLATGDPNKITSYSKKVSNRLNAEIATPLYLSGSNFAIGLNYRNSGDPGSVVSVRVTDNGYGRAAGLSVTWTRSTSQGIAASPMYYGGYVYASGKYGNIYKINATSGAVAWTSKIGSVTLINNSPATDGTYIYQPVRNPGKVVKIRMSDGAKIWSLAQGLQVNGSKIDSDIKTGNMVGNDTTYWKTPDGRQIVFYGDTYGQLNFLTTSGYRTDVVLDKETSSIAKSSVFASRVLSGTYWEYQGTGLATESLLAKNHLVFGINTTTTMGETWFYSVGIADDMYVKSVEGGEYQAGTRVLSTVKVGSKDFGSGTRVPVVRFYVDGELISSKRINLNPGEEKDVEFIWTVPTNKKKGVITATINVPSEFTETDMTNNTKSANYSTTKGYNICTKAELKDSALVKSVSYTDSEGNSHTVHYYEYLVSTLSNPTPQKIRAGYGFNFVTTTHYLDETASFSGPKKATAYFPDSPNYVDKKVELDKTSTSGPSYNQTAKWELPLIYVENYSGNVFYNKNDSRVDSSDEFVVKQGERKWYTDFYTQDGDYVFKVVESGAGKNNLTSCATSYVEVKGTPFDDFVRRSVIPDTPFLDSKVGYNWKGKEDLIGDLGEFYYNLHNNDDGESTYYLSNETIKEIKDEDVETLDKSEAEYFFGSYNFN